MPRPGQNVRYFMYICKVVGGGEKNPMWLCNVHMELCICKYKCVFGCACSFLFCFFGFFEIAFACYLCSGMYMQSMYVLYMYIHMYTAKRTFLSLLYYFFFLFFFFCCF